MGLDHTHNAHNAHNAHNSHNSHNSHNRGLAALVCRFINTAIGRTTDYNANHFTHTVLSQGGFVVCTSDVMCCITTKLSISQFRLNLGDRIRIVYLTRDVVAFIYEEFADYRDDDEDLGTVLRVHVDTLASGVHAHHVLTLDTHTVGRIGVATRVATKIAAIIDDAVLSTVLA